MIQEVFKKRCIMVSIIFTLSFLLLVVFKIIKVQYYDSPELKVLAQKQYTIEENTDELNYMVFDSEGRNFLDYKINYKIVIQPYIFKIYNKYTSKEDMKVLEEILRNKSKYTLESITSQNTSDNIRFDVDEGTYNDLKEINTIKGMYLYTFTSINKAVDNSIQSIITTTKKTVDGKVVDKADNSLEMGIHKATNNNKHSVITFDKGIDGLNTEGKSIQPSDNINIKLTIDKKMQEILKEVLEKETYSSSKEVGILMMESSTGKIKAMALKDDKESNVILCLNESGYAPGSIFKVIVEETGLDLNSISLQDKYTCESGKDSLCREVHGRITAEEALTVSCNNAFAEMGKKIKFENIKAVADSQGIFKKVLEIDSEAKGYVDELGVVRNLAIGQSMSITPIQAISIANTVINKGLYVKPYIIDAYVNNNNSIIKQFTSGGNSVIKESTSDIMKAQMIKVVKLGTGKLAAVSNVEIGGKTGTNERIVKGEKHSDGWFVGFFKVNGLYYTMVVFVKDIDINRESGGTTAAPIFKDSVIALKSYIEK